jgi:pimeloyl-ACP methyl ester carboxylesterase
LIPFLQAPKRTLFVGHSSAILILLLLVRASATDLAAQSLAATDIPVNILLRVPAPVTPLTKWVDDSTSHTVSLEVDGATLRGWKFPAPASSHDAPTLLFFYGGATILHDRPVFAEIAQSGVNVVIYDYRGYGFSSGIADVMAFRRDALLAYDDAARQAGGPVMVYGFSMGTAMAAYVASVRPVKAVILAGAIASAAEEFPRLVQVEGAPPDTRKPSPEAVEAFDEVGRMRRSKAPLLMLHGEADVVVPIAQGREVFAASLSKLKTFTSLPSIGHFETAASPVAQAAVRKFLLGLQGAD